MKNLFRIFKIKTFVFIILSGYVLASCESYLDVVPDNIATIDNAFTDRVQAEKFLFTLYSYLPMIGIINHEGRFDDLTWRGYTANVISNSNICCTWEVLRNGNRSSNPYSNNWEGMNGGTPLFQAIRKCNIMLEKIDEVRDLDAFEKIRWSAETKFLKAYYHFLLLQQYGPIPIIDVNLPVSAGNEEVLVERLPVDEVFDYIIDLIDEAMPELPLLIEDATIEMGRVTQAAALAVKAKIAVTAASPLFNGNTTYSSFKNTQGQPFFSEYDPDKWTKAVAACKQAIDTCHRAGHALYEYKTTMSPETQKIVQVSRIITDKWNEEHVWGIAWPGRFRQNEIDLLQGPVLDRAVHLSGLYGVVNPTIKAAEMFYSNHGVPIEEDKFYDYENRYETVPTTPVNNKFVQTGRQTALLHLNREYRFYGSIAFDGGWWFGWGRHDENNQWPVNTKNGEVSGQRSMERFSCSGMYIKKLINVEGSWSSAGNYTYVKTDYPILRMADIYLLYAEALNEQLPAPNDGVWDYVNLVRERAGLETVQYSWTNYAKNPDKYTTKSGMRDIIRRERNIELMFECHRYFDLRRWNIAQTELTGPVRGWNYMGSTIDDYYQLTTIDDILFTDRDVLTPIRTGELARNKNLIQNPGW